MAQAISLRLLSPYYELAREMLDAQPLTPPPGRGLPARTALSTRRASVRDVNPSWYRSRFTPVFRARTLTALWNSCPAFSGNCALGCATNAKNAMDVTYLPIAEANGAEVWPFHTAEGIQPVPDGGYRVRFSQRDPRFAGAHREPGSVEAATVVVAAGTPGTNELLLRCRDGTAPSQTESRAGLRFSGTQTFCSPGR